MKAREWQRLVGPLLPAEQGWRHRGKLAYRCPFDSVLTGVLGESSSTQASYIWQLVMPLYEQVDHVVLSYSRRIGGGAHRVDDGDTAEIERCVTTAAAGLPDEVTALSRLAGLSLDTENIRIFETAAYAQFLLGQPRQAMATLDAAVKPKDSLTGSSWVVEVNERMTSVSRMLAADAIQDVSSLLAGWTVGTVSALGLAC